MAFRRATGRDEMLKRNMEKLAARRRASASKPTATKQELKVNPKPTVDYVGMYGKDAPEYGKTLEGVKPPTQVQPPPQAYPDPPPPVRPDPPAETPPAQPQAPSGRFADLRGNTPENPNTEKDKSHRSDTKPPEIPKSLLDKLRSRDDGEGKLDPSKFSLLKNIVKQLSKGPTRYPIGLRKDGKRWAGNNYGFQSEANYKKLKAEGKI